MTNLLVTMDDVHRDAEAVHAWLRAHDLDPNRTIPGVLIAGDHVTAALYLVDEKGKRVVERDPFTDAVVGLKTETVTIPLRQPLPAGLGTVTY
jgi:hypothetical protein